MNLDDGIVVWEIEASSNRDIFFNLVMVAVAFHTFFATSYCTDTVKPART